jgi:hypothetical protein
MNCKKYRVKKYVNRNGVIYYICQEKILGLFWYGMFRSYEVCGYQLISNFSTPRIYYKLEEAIKDVKQYIQIESDRAAAYKAAKEKIKNSNVVCVE